MRSRVKAEFVLPSGSRIPLRKYHETFKAWHGPAIDDTYGSKAVLDWHGEPLFAELVVLRQWQARGWDGAWVDSFRRQFRTGMREIVTLPPTSIFA
jgi:hypothetical protein